MKIVCTVLLFLSLLLSDHFFKPLVAQTTSIDESNLIPNSSFEEYASTPIGWFYRGEHFSQVMRYWSSPTAASPDAFGQKVRVPDHWADKGFGDQYAHSGSSMVGFTVFGCDDGKPHCREYVQVQLLEPLVPQQEYYIEFWVVHLLRSLQTNNLGVYFSNGKINIRVDEPIYVTPDFYTPNVLKADNHKWTKVSGRFIAKNNADYIVLGNFFPDSLTIQEFPTADDPLRFAYYYLDDVLLKKVPPFLEVPLAPNDLSIVQLKEGGIFQLSNVFFDTDKAELLPRSYIELKKLLHILQEHPDMTIEIRGHTDSQGNDSYNYYLSKRRAQAVAEFLNQNGIPKERTHFIGLGSSRPIAPNDTEAGRQLNRRVEFLILKI
jgi:outer membrane protein OmpA-like peptidoglycan-associated protein